MDDDRTTLEMLKEVAFKAPWPLVERITHLILAVVVGYWIGSYGKAKPKKALIALSKEQRSSCKKSGKSALKVSKSAAKTAELAESASVVTELESLRDYWCALGQAAEEECARLTAMLP